MLELMAEIRVVIDSFKAEYPEIAFTLTQDQTFVLDAGIQNLNQDLLFGAIFCVLLLFLLLGNYAAPTLMSISLPCSLLITFIFFFLFDISLNIISLSGLALGIGMLIDNSIIVIDAITRRRRQDIDMMTSCVEGVEEVAVPVISQVLTTVAVYVPLVYLSGLAGSLVFDQAIALTVSLSVSLLISFFLNPVLYSLFLKADPATIREDTKLFSFLSKKYHSMIEFIMRRKYSFFFVTVLLIPISLLLTYFVPLNALPNIKTSESLLLVEWNDPISVSENAERIKRMSNELKPVLEWEADVGIEKVPLSERRNTLQSARVYFKFQNEVKRDSLEDVVRKYLRSQYPKAEFTINDAPNAFTQLFENRNPYFEVRVAVHDATEVRNLDIMFDHIAQKYGGITQSPGLEMETSLKLGVNVNELNRLGVDLDKFYMRLKELFGERDLTTIENIGKVYSVRATTHNSDNLQKILLFEVEGRNHAHYPIRKFVEYSFRSEPKFITADRSGVYKSITFEKIEGLNYNELRDKLMREGAELNLQVYFTGQYFDNIGQANQMFGISVIVFVLLYFILCIQFESLIQPLLVMLTIPFGIGGAMLLLIVTGNSLNIMSAIGFIVVLGIIVDDPILKVETINRLAKNYLGEGIPRMQAVERAISEAGVICLKPLLMTSLTTSLALVPILFTPGIGSELQKPFVLVIVGGLTIGTILTLWFVPLGYWFLARYRLGVK